MTCSASAVGADTITGDSSGGILVGHLTRNTLIAGAGRSILIGGSGVNVLNGGAADDLLINGRTSYDANLAVLESILATWQSTTETYAQRIAALQAAGARTSSRSARPSSFRPGSTRASGRASARGSSFTRAV